MKTSECMTDIHTLRPRGREHLEEGVMTPGYKARPAVVMSLLNDALATEIVCAFAMSDISSWLQESVLRLLRPSFSSMSLRSSPMRTESRNASFSSGESRICLRKGF